MKEPSSSPGLGTSTLYLRNSIAAGHSFADIYARDHGSLDTNIIVLLTIAGTVTSVNRITSSPNLNANFVPIPPSPAINAGNNFFLLGLPVPVSTDYYGKDRIFEQVVDLGAVEWGAGNPPIPYQVFCFTLRVNNCSGQVIQRAQIDFETRASLLDSMSCQLVDPFLLPAQIRVSTGVANTNAWNGVSVTNVLLRTVTLAPGEHVFSVCFNIQAECINLLAPIWSLGGQLKCCDGKCLPVHQSAIAAVDCLPREIYLP